MAKNANAASEFYEFLKKLSVVVQNGKLSYKSTTFHQKFLTDSNYVLEWRDSLDNGPRLNSQFLFKPSSHTHYLLLCILAN